MSKFELNDKVAIVTGGGGTAHGIGRSISLSVAGMGAKVAVVGRHRDALDRVVAEIREQVGEAVAVPADVTDPMQVERMVAGDTGCVRQRRYPREQCRRHLFRQTRGNLAARLDEQYRPQSQ